MCSINGDFDGTKLLEKQESIDSLNGLICQRCNTEQAQVTLRKKDVYCNGCFLINATHKFRATLGKSKIVRPTDTILVTHNGKCGSTALLNLIKAGMHASVYKRLVFQVEVLYIDDGILKNKSAEERKEKINVIQQQIESVGFESCGISLSSAMNFTESSIISPLSDLTCCSENENDQNLLKLWSELSDETSKRDFLHKLKQKLMFLVAKSLKCQKVFLAEDSTSLAISILSNVSVGRGAQLASDCGFIDNRYSDVMILRPMRDFSRFEVEYYLKVKDYKYIEEDEKEGNSNMYSSIQHLTGKFLTDLENQFGGTVSTIFRTGEKISTGIQNKKSQVSSDDCCVFCHGCLDTDAPRDTASAIKATNFSRLISSKGSNAELDLNKIGAIEQNGETPKSGCQNCSCSRKRNDLNNLSCEDIRQFLCYACQLIFNDKSNITTLPSYVISSVNERLRLKSMATEIQDFLL